MSGKQWWPMVADLHESLDATRQFQDRLRDRGLIGDSDLPILHHIIKTDGRFAGEALTSCNDYMQLSNQDSLAKAQSRVAVARLLASTIKMMVALKPEGRMSGVPCVFCLPMVGGGLAHGLIASWDIDSSSSRPLTLIISETDALPGLLELRGSIRHWRLVQGANTKRWLTHKTWLEQRKEAAFGKWLFGSYSERKAWAESLDADGISTHKLVKWKGDLSDINGKALGAIHHSGTGEWLLPGFWDQESVNEWITHQQKPIKPVAKYASSFKPGRRPDPEHKLKDEQH